MNSDIMIRKAEKEDVRQIAEILVEDWKTAYRGIIDDAFLDSMSVDQRYEIEIKRYQKYVVASDGNEILGYAWLEMTGDEAADPGERRKTGWQRKAGLPRGGFQRRRSRRRP